MIFADDTQIYLSRLPSELDRGIDLIAHDVGVIARYTADKGLKLNLTKFNAIILGSRAFVSRIDLSILLRISTGSIALPFVSVARNRGVLFYLLSFIPFHIFFMLFYLSVFYLFILYFVCNLYFMHLFFVFFLATWFYHGLINVINLSLSLSLSFSLSLSLSSWVGRRSVLWVRWAWCEIIYILSFAVPRLARTAWADRRSLSESVGGVHRVLAMPAFAVSASPVVFILCLLCHQLLLYCILLLLLISLSAEYGATTLQRLQYICKEGWFHRVHRGLRCGLSHRLYLGEVWPRSIEFWQLRAFSLWFVHHASVIRYSEESRGWP